MRKISGVVFIIMVTGSVMKQEKKYTMLCLGDSYTIGEAVKESECFPMQTVELLQRENLKFENPRIIAKTGWTTDELTVAVKEQNLNQDFNFVTLLIGVNNQYRGRDIENYRTEFTSLLNTAIKFANGKRNLVVVVSIPDWGVTPFGYNDKRGERLIAQEIDKYNMVNKEEALKAKVNYIDITPHSRKAKVDKTLIAEDGLHPSGKMYREWAEKLAQVIKQQLRQ